jgi:hypothetical protein
MLKKPLLLALFAILSFLAWRHFTATPPPPPPPIPLTPEQEVNALLSQSVIPAKELAEFCEKYPSLVTSAFKRERRPFSVTGRISKALTLGVDSNNCAIETDGSKNLRIKFSSDLNRLLRWAETSSSSEEYKKILIKFHIEDRSLLALIFGVERETGIRRLLSSKVVCREGETITLRGEFRHIGSGWVKCDLLELP